MEIPHVVRRSCSEDERSVLDALTAGAKGLSINDVTARWGGETSQTCCALAALEAEGLVRFRCGRWTLRPYGELSGAERSRPA